MKIKKLMVLPLILTTFTSCELNLGTSGLLSNETTSQIEQSTTQEIDNRIVKLKVWCEESQTNFIEETVEKFKNLYPDVKFNFTIEDVDDF